MEIRDVGMDGIHNRSIPSGSRRSIVRFVVNDVKRDKAAIIDEFNNQMAGAIGIKNLIGGFAIVFDPTGSRREKSIQCLKIRRVIS